MKKAGKKICAGVFACVALFSLTGCNLFQKDLSEEQIDKLMYVLDNADKFMDENISLLEKSNKEKNVDEVYNLLVLTGINFNLNKDNIHDNLEIRIQINENGTSYNGYAALYKDENGKQYYVYESGASDSYKELVYEKDGKVYHCYSEHGRVEISDYSNYPSVDAYLLNQGILDSFVGFLASAPKEQIIDVEVVENGNYKATFSYSNSESENETRQSSYETIVIEISREGKLIKYSADVVYTAIYNTNGPIDEYEVDYEKTSRVVEFKYNEVDKNKVMSYVTEFEAAAN